MIGIKAISSYIPKEGVDNFKQAETFEESALFVETKLGARFLPRLEQGDDTSDIAVKAVGALLCESDLAKEDIDALIVVTQNPDGQGLPHCAALVHKKLALPTHVAAFDVSLGCSGYVYGLSILQGFLAASGKKNGVLVTADPYSKVITTPNRTTSMLFGDAATATWMGENPQLVVSDCSFGTDGKGADVLIDMLSGDFVNKNMEATKINGHLINIGRLAGMNGNFNYDLHAKRRLHYVGTTGRTRSVEENLDVARVANKDLWDHVVDGNIRHVIFKTFRLNEASDALNIMNEKNKKDANKIIGDICNIIQTSVSVEVMADKTAEMVKEESNL